MNILKSRKDRKNDWWDNLTAEEQAQLEATLVECDDHNNMVSDEDAQRLINLWLTSESIPKKRKY
jgi:hypothetical protein